LGNCTWYVFGRMRELGYSLTQLNAIAVGNASQWAANASSIPGVTVDANPAVGAIAQLNIVPMHFDLGHVAVVESVNSDGTITVTESSSGTDTSSAWDFLWRHRTVSPTWFSNFIHVAQTNPCTLINNVNDLQNINQNLSGNYCLTQDIDASATAQWNGGAGFVPIGYSPASTTNSTVPTYGALVGVNATPNQFLGTFDGRGHTISNLFIKNMAAFNLGLFSWIGQAGAVRNVGLVTGSLTVGGGYQNFGLLAGWNFGTISNSYASGSVSGGDGAGSLGGLVGWNWGGTIIDSYATSNVGAGVGASRIGGLAGFNGYYLNGGGTITNGHATGTVTGGVNSSSMGGLVGDNDSAVIRNSYAIGNVSGGNGSSSLGGLAGLNNGYWGGDQITSSYAAGNVSGGNGSTYVGGLVGANIWLGTITNSYATGGATGGNNVGGLVGWNGYTSTSIPASISTSYATGFVTGPSGSTGGLVGFNNSGSITFSYWDVQTTGTALGLGGSNGGTWQGVGLTTAQLKTGLPSGFDPTIWASNPSINSGYPNLLGITSILNATTTVLSSSQNPTTYGALLTFTATVTPSGSSSLPTGSVTFNDGSTPIGNGTLNGAGLTTLPISSLAVGSHQITAVYSGDNKFSSSTSTVLTQVVNVSIQNYTLSVSVSGNGTVTSSPAGINCGSICTMNYGGGTSVTLTATPAGGAVFNGWRGACNGIGDCTVTMNSATSVIALFSAPGGPPSARSWVSAALGNDANPCTRNAPCLTFAAALAQTTAGGEIDVLDPGDFGPVTITKAISIDGDAVGGASILTTAGTNGIVINAGATDAVNLRGLVLDGAGASATSGVVFNTGASLHIQDCVFQGFTAAGIMFSPGAGGANTTRMAVEDSTILDNGPVAAVLIKPTGGIAAQVSFSRVDIHNNTGGGLRADGSGGSGAINVAIADSAVSLNAINGIVAVSGSANVAVSIMRVFIAANGSAGVQATQSSGGTASVTVGDSVLYGNNIAVQATGGATLLSYLNNHVTGNVTNGGFTGGATLQ
jgi:surface antigen